MHVWQQSHDAGFDPVGLPGRQIGDRAAALHAIDAFEVVLVVEGML